MTSERRNEMGAAAVAAAEAISYVGAGTVEFIVDKGGVYHFMEMNTRLQVEHPVTEMITGLDLVEWQLRVAAGERLPLQQSSLDFFGHAIEARIYAEDPERGFLPSIGNIAYLEAPPESDSLRIDTGVRAGDEISRFYDPMIAKLVVWGDDRESALRRLSRALSSYRVVGVTTNIPFLQRVVAHPAFANAHLDTGLIARYQEELLTPAGAPSPQLLAIAAIAEFLRMVGDAARQAHVSQDRWSPWHAVDPWWLNSESHAISFIYSSQAARHEVRLRMTAGSIRVGIAGAEGAPGENLTARASRRGDEIAITLDGVERSARVVPRGRERYVYLDGHLQKLSLVDPLAHIAEEVSAGGHLTAPMSGTIVAVLVKAGDTVAKGAPLLVLEAMKMEHTIAAPSAGIVSAVHYRLGDQVSEGTALIDVDGAEAQIGGAKLRRP